MTDFEKLVLDMRCFQKQYFRTRDVTLLQRSKELEKAVDEYLREAQRTEKEPTLPGLDA